MGILKIVDDSPSFATGQPLSAEMLNLMRDNALALSEASYAGAVAHADRYGEPPENNDTNPVTVWRGGFVFVTGMTTLRVVTFTTGQQAGDTLRVYRGDGTSTSNDLTLTNGTQTHTITISGAGYTHGQIVLLRLDLRNASAGSTYAWGNVEIREVTAYPVDLPDAFPGVPTFGAITAANLNQLSNCIDWLTRRVALRYEPLQQAVLRRVGPYHNAGGTQTTVRRTGSVRRSPAQTELYVVGQAHVTFTGATETIRLIVNGAVVNTFSVPQIRGTHAFTLTASLSSFSTDTLVPILVDYIRTAGGEAAGTINKWSVFEIATRPTSGTPAALSTLSARVPMSFATLQTWLNDLATIVDDTYDRIVANYPVWQGQRCYRARFTQGDPADNDPNYRLFEPWVVALSPRRMGEAIAVRGKGVTIGYGPGRFLEEYNEVGAQKFENFRTASVISGDTVQSATFYLDTVEGLPAGSPYNLRGEDLFYAAEIYKVVD